MDRVAVALGSNLGDRGAHLDYAVARLQTFLDDLKVSPYREYPPVGVPEAQPPYLNAAAVGSGPLSPRALMDALLGVERERGRERPYARAPRTLDLDLILFGAVVADEPGLVVPHPRFRERRFVLEPLAEIAADVTDPVTGLTVGELARRIAGG